MKIVNCKLKINLKGFTLIELLVVITIIGILAGIALVSYGGAQERSRDSRRKQDLKTIKDALSLAKQDTPGEYTYPSCDDTSTCPVISDTNTNPHLAPTYIKSVPKDPKTGSSYFDYRYYPLDSTGVMCHASGSPCVKFKLITCLENKNDPQKDPNDSAHILCSVYGGPGAGYILYSD